MTLETESGAIIKKIDKQCKGIIEKITSCQTSNNLHQIEVWIRQQIKSEPKADNIQILAILIDTIYHFFKEASDIDKTRLIERCLADLINNWSNFSPEKIQEIICQLKVYIKTDDTEAQAALKEFIDKSSGSINFLIVISKKLVSSCQKSLSNFSIINKSELNNTYPAIELATDAGSAPTPLFNASFPETIGNNSTKYKKKNNTRLIMFDKNGEGYVANKKYNFVSKKNESVESYKFVYQNQTQSQLTIDIYEGYLFINFLRKNEINFEKDIKSLFKSFALEEFKYIIFKRIYDFKAQNSKNFFSEYYKTNFFLLPSFLDIQSEYLDNFLLLINFLTLEKLAKKSETIANNINTLFPILDDIVEFYSEWDVNHKFHEFLLLRNNFKTNFNKKTFVHYLEHMICLIETNKLELDKISLNFHFEVSNMKLKKLSENVKTKINELKSSLSIDQFLKKQQEAIQLYFNKNFQINLDNFDLNTNLVAFKLFVIKLYKFMLNFFCINFFINYISNLDFFKSKLDLLNLELDCLSPEKINDEFTSKLNWLTLLKNGINPFFLLYKPYKKNLSEKLFLYMVNIKFLNAIEINFDIGAFPNKKHKLLNDLRLIQICLENAKIGSISDLDCFYEKKNINIQKIGEQIIQLLNDNEAFKEYLKALINLDQNTQVLNEEFSMLCDTTQKNIINSWEAQINKDLSKHIRKGYHFFKLPQQADQIPSSSLIMHKI